MRRIALPLAAVTLLAAGAAPPAPAAAAATKTVVLRSFAFSPEAVFVRRGDTVRWVWRDGAIAHNVTFAGGGPRSASKASGSYSRRFRRAGRFRYRCTLHTGMVGRVVVR